jgi:hypothetical protein
VSTLQDQSFLASGIWSERLRKRLRLDVWLQFNSIEEIIREVEGMLKAG